MYEIHKKGKRTVIRGMDFFIEHLKDVLHAVNKNIENHRLTINTRNIRRCYDIESSNRSKINFISRSLEYLEKKGILILINGKRPKNYMITVKKNINIEQFICQIRQKRLNSN